MAIGIAIAVCFTTSAVVSWSSLYYILKSGTTWYKRETNTAGGYFKLWYSGDSGVTWEELMNLDLTEESVIIDLAHEYRHRIVDEDYHVDQTLTPTGYAGIEGTDWENIEVIEAPWIQPFSSNALFVLDGVIIEDSGSYYLKDKTQYERNFLITGIDWLTDSKVVDIFPFKTNATISAPAGDAALIAADVNNFLYDAGGTPNAITPQMLFQNIDYENKLFCRHEDHVLNTDNTELIYSGVKDIILYANVKSGADLVTCNTYFGVPVKITSDVYWVAKDGDDGTGDGSELLPYLTVQKAQSMVSAGQTRTVYVKSGEYSLATAGYDYLRMNNANNTITYTGLGRVRWTSANATQIIYWNGSGRFTFNRIQFYGTKILPLYYIAQATPSDMSYCDIACVGSGGNAGDLNNPSLYRCKLTGALNVYATGTGKTNINDCLVYNRSVTIYNKDSADNKATVQYSKVVNTLTSASNAILFDGTYFDFLYNTCFQTNTGIIMYVLYRSTAKGVANVRYNNYSVTGNATSILGANGACVFSTFNCYNNTISHVNVNFQCTYISGVITNNFNFHYNTVISTSKVGFCPLRLAPTTNVACAVSIKYNYCDTKATSMGAHIDLTESAALSGGELVFNGAEIMYNYIKGGNVDYPLEVQNVHGILARSGKNMKIAYNRIENCAIGIVYKTEGVECTSGGVYGNVLINNQVSIYLRCANSVKVYGNTCYQVAAGLNSYLMTINTQIQESSSCLVENNIFYRNNSAAPAVALFGIEAAALVNGCQIRNNIYYSPDTLVANFLYDAVDTYTLAEAVAAGWAVDVVEDDAEITAIRPYPLVPVEGATDLGNDYDDGLDISSVWSDAVVLKQQGASWQYGAYVQ